MSADGPKPPSGRSFDRLVSATEERERQGKPEHLGGLHDDKLDLRGLHHRQVGGLSCERVLLIKWDGPARSLPSKDLLRWPREVGQCSNLR